VKVGLIVPAPFVFEHPVWVGGNYSAVTSDKCPAITVHPDKEGSDMWHCRRCSCAFKVTYSDDCVAFDDVSVEYGEGADGR